MSAPLDLPESLGRDDRFIALCGSFSRGAGAFVFLAGALTLLGWFFNFRFLLWISPDQVVMKASAAVAFVLAGISLWMVSKENGNRRAACACALPVALLGILTLGAYAAGWSLDLDRLLVAETPQSLKTLIPGKMGPSAALNFVLLGTSLLLLCRQRGYWVASVMAFVAGSVATLTLLGYTYAEESQAGVASYARVSFHKALAFIVLATGVFLAAKDRGLMRPLSRDGAGSVMARRLLPAVILVPLLFEWLTHKGLHVGLFGGEFGMALMVVASMVALALVVLRSAVVLNEEELERRRAEETLKVQEKALARTTEILETVFSNVQFMIVYLDSRFNFIRVNPAYAAACGYPPEFFPGKNHFDLYPHAENEAIFRRAVATGEPFTVFAKPFEFPDRPDRGVTYWDWSLQPVKGADGTVRGLIFCLRDVTESVRAESRVRESEQRLEMAIESANLGLWDLNLTTGRAVLNENWAGMMGYASSEIEPTYGFWERLVHPDDLPGVAALFKDHLEGRTPFFEAEYRMRAKSGEWRWIYSRGKVIERDDGGRPVRATGINQEITKAKELEQVALQQEKMSVLGQLAAGIAHEIRNPLSGLNIYLSAAETLSGDAAFAETGTRERLQRALGTARAASIKIEGVIRRVMDFVRPSPSRPGLMKVNDVVAESVELAAVTLRKSGVRVVTTLPEGLPPCRADSRLIEQLLLNLITNAIQAMEGIDGDKAIEIATGTEGNRVFIKLADSGPGVPEELRERIFEPFFTTKHSGTGLGLSLGRRIVSEHGGTLEVGTGRLGGAEFRVFLPVASEDAHETAAPDAGSAPA